MNQARRFPFVSRRAFHLALLAFGTLFLLVGAFHGNVWFDESYSVAIANHSFGEIWSIGSGDVHPILFYWALHVLNLVFGQNILVYRLFAVLGAVALAALGYTHVRRDFGWRIGVLFSFLALFVPYVAVMAVEIRMYSWATFSVMLCAVYAYRIVSLLRAGGSNEGAVAALASGLPLWGGAPRRWWLVFFAASLASAYLHYFGVLSAFVVNLLMLAFLLQRAFKLRKSPLGHGGVPGGRPLAVFLLGAVAQVALYAPWLAALASQMGVVSQTYWANMVFPATYIELATYPIMTSQMSFASRGAYGGGWQVLVAALGIVALVLLMALAVWAVWRATKLKRPWSVSGDVRAALAALAVYGGVLAIAWAASYAMNSLILYYRYLFVAIGPLLFACAVLLSHVRSRMLVGGVCAVLLGTSLTSQALFASDCYASDNQVPLERFEEAAESLAADEGGVDPLVVSSDIGIEGVTAVTFPDIPQTYMDWQKGNWDQSYRAYEPTLSSQKSWELILDDFHGRFIVLGQSQNGEEPRDVADLSQKPGITKLESQTYYRPYERTWFTIAVMEKE